MFDRPNGKRNSGTLKNKQVPKKKKWSKKCFSLSLMIAFIVHTKGSRASEEAIHSSPDRGSVWAFCHFYNEITAAIGKTIRQQGFTFISSFVSSFSSHLYLTCRALSADPKDLKTEKKRRGKMSFSSHSAPWLWSLFARSFHVCGAARKQLEQFAACKMLFL